MAKRTEQVFGVHAVKQLLETSPERILKVWMQAEIHSDAVNAIHNQMNQLGFAVQKVPRSTMSKMSKNQNHQGVIIEIKPERKKTDDDLERILAQHQNDKPLYLILDSIQDPHNLGACIRTAEATAVSAIIVPKDRAVGINETVRKVASGAVDNSTVITVTNLVRAIKKIKAAGVWVIGMDGSVKESLYDLDLNVPLAIVMGGEGKGLRDSVLKECDYIAALPILGKTESLNVSVATGVALYETIRQR